VTATGAAFNDEFVRAFLRAWEQRDTERIMASFADDAVYHAMPLAPIVGKDALREFVTSFETVPGGRLEVHHQLASDGVVVNERTDHLSFHGRQLVVPICAVFEIEDGLIAAWREYFDLALFTAS
jgi:limonene-1,2-epoxide hydrolase